MTDLGKLGVEKLREMVERLQGEVEKLRGGLKQKKQYGLVWGDKEEAVVARCRRELPVLKEDKDLAISADGDAPTNLLIEGDNYHALSVLNYTHAGKIDVIYIDPPYNTGAKDWKYNNNFVDKNDGCRHSKWLSMMANRLGLVKNLLTPKGIICVAIDHHELFNLGVSMDEIFGEKNRLGIISVVIKEGGRNLADFFSVTNEFYLVYARDKSEARFNEVALDKEVAAQFNMKDDRGRYKLEKFIRDFDPDATREKKPNRWYPIYVSRDLRDITLEKKEGYHEIFPVSSTGREMVWNTLPDTFQCRVREGDIVAVEQGDAAAIMRKVRENQVFKTHWVGKKYDAIAHGTNLLKTMLGKGVFDYPKPLYAVVDFLKITSRKDSVILDFFAGSGTTGHAVSVLNKEDGGRRRFILCTNNENGIAREVCQPRIKAVIEGNAKLPDITGIPSNLKYFQTDFVLSDVSPTNQDKVRLTDKAAEMLCVRENIFEPIEINTTYRIYGDGRGRFIGIIYELDAIADFKETAAKHEGEFSVYVFSLSDDDCAEEFADMRNKVKLQPIPEVILRVYRRIFRKKGPLL